MLVINEQELESVTLMQQRAYGVRHNDCFGFFRSLEMKILKIQIPPPPFSLILILKIQDSID